MAAIRYKELLGWYVITLKLRETGESQLPKKSTYGSEIVPDYELRPSKSEWVISIERKVAQGRQENMPCSWANLSIYRIPHYLKNGEDKAWVPQIVSLGPYHHNAEHLRRMEQHKWRCLHRILKRFGQGIGLYLESVKKVERRARAYYEGRISMSCDEFVEMMVLDGCFMIEMFQGFVEGFEELGYPPNDPVFSMRGSILQIQRDMIMLENQIPLFILDRLLGLQLGYLNRKECVTKLVLQFLSPLVESPQKMTFYFKIRQGSKPEELEDPEELEETEETEEPEEPEELEETEETEELEEPEETVHPIDKDSCKRLKFDPLYYHGKDHCLNHCLEVFQRSLVHLGLKRPKIEKWSQSRRRFTYCVSELQEAGIQIKWRSSSSMGDIHFENGILGILPIEINEGTRSLFLNLIAFEQSHFTFSHHVTSYVIFMNNLMKSPEDVMHLRNQNVIHHCLGSDAEVADLFHRLCQEVAFERQNSYLWDLCQEVEKYYMGLFPLIGYNGGDNYTVSLCFMMGVFIACWWGCWIAFLTRKWNAWKAVLSNKYFDNPWSIISLIAVFVLLVLTFIQAFYTVYAYYRPWS